MDRQVDAAKAFKDTSACIMAHENVFGRRRRGHGHADHDGQAQQSRFVILACDTLARIAEHPAPQTDEFLSWNWATSRAQRESGGMSADAIPDAANLRPQPDGYDRPSQKRILSARESRLAGISVIPYPAGAFLRLIVNSKLFIGKTGG